MYEPEDPTNLVARCYKCDPILEQGPFFFPWSRERPRYADHRVKTAKSSLH